MPHTPRLPDPAVVVLIGASGSGKSSWAAARYRPSEIVSSDALRAVVGSGEHDLAASKDAFALLDEIVAARLRRKLCTVIDTLGLDPVRRGQYLEAARTAGLPAVAVVLNTDPELCRRRNAARDRPVPALALRQQFARVSAALTQVQAETWDQLVTVDTDESPAPEADLPVPEEPANQLNFVLQISRFPWGTDPAGWLGEVARTAEQAGFNGLALMDHLIQIPQVDRAWEPIPEPYVTLGLLAGLSERLKLGTLVSPVTFRPPGIIAKSIATLDAVSGGRAFLGLGAGWWEREHAAFGLPFPAAGERLHQLESAIETIRALWAPGTKAYRGEHVQLPETTCYPRPTGKLPIIVGGGGERRTLRIAARYGDGCNLQGTPEVLEHKITILREHCRDLGRDPAEVEITVLDLPIVGSDREQVANTVERLRGRVAAPTFAARHHAGTVDDQLARYQELADLGVSTVFVSPLGLGSQVEQFARITAAFAH